MTPRNTQLGASASALRAPSVRVPRAASPRASRSSTTKHPTRSAAPKAARKPSAATKTGRTPTGAAAKARETTAHRWWLLPVIIIAVVSVFVAAYYPVARVQYRETRERTRLQAELDAIRARNNRLRAEVARLKTPEGVEDYARVQLGLVKKGEHQVVVVDGTEPTHTLVAQGAPHIDSQEAVKPPVGQWTAFLDAIFGVQ